MKFCAGFFKFVFQFGNALLISTKYFTIYFVRFLIYHDHEHQSRTHILVRDFDDSCANSILTAILYQLLKSSLVTILFFLRSLLIPLLGVLLTLQVFLLFLLIGRAHPLFAAVRALVTSSLRFEGIVASVTGIDFLSHRASPVV